MRRVSLSDIRGLPDIQSKEHFNLNVGATPGGAVDRNLHLKCHSVSFPGIANEPIIVNLWGHQVKHRGKINSTLQMNAVYYEDSAFKTTKALRKWHNAVVNAESGTSLGNKFAYSVLGKLEFYTHTGEVAYEANIVNMFVENIGEVELSGDSSAPLMVNVTFGYDFIQEGDFLEGLLTNIGLDIASDVLGIDLSGIGLTFPDAVRNIGQQGLGLAIDAGVSVAADVISDITGSFG